MGITNVRATVGNPADVSRTSEVEFLVDSGATYRLVPSEILAKLGIAPHSVREFVLGNGEFVEWALRLLSTWVCAATLS